MAESERVPWQRLDVSSKLVVGFDVRDDLPSPYVMFSPFPPPHDVPASVTFLEVLLHAKVIESMNVRWLQYLLLVPADVDTRRCSKPNSWQASSRARTTTGN